MEKKEIIESNKLIAEFMGNPVRQYKEDEPINSEYGEQQYASFDCEMAIINNKCFDLYSLQYHSSWDWLMPVVEKINTIALDDFGEMNVMMAANECIIGEEYLHPIIEQRRDFKKPMIEMVWLAVIEFIKWYNLQPK